MNEAPFPELVDEFWDFIIMDKIGSGAYRDVYTVRYREDVVVKVENAPKQFMNVFEYNIYNTCPAELAKWLAPCYYISENGRFLAQHRTTPVPADKLPGKIPKFFRDVHIHNWGYLWGTKKIVCHDYSLYTKVFKTRLVKARFGNSITIGPLI